MKFISSAIIVFILTTIMSCDFGGGSYPYVERYEIHMSENQLIEVIKNFKKNNPQYNVPNTLELTEGRDTTKIDHWYHMYFYFPKENQILYTWTRPIDKNNTTFAFVSVNEGLKIGSWKRINKDFTDEQNEAEKKIFEERIVNKIRSTK